MDSCGGDDVNATVVPRGPAPNEASAEDSVARNKLHGVWGESCMVVYAYRRLAPRKYEIFCPWRYGGYGNAVSTASRFRCGARTARDPESSSALPFGTLTEADIIEKDFDLILNCFYFHYT